MVSPWPGDGGDSHNIKKPQPYYQLLLLITVLLFLAPSSSSASEVGYGPGFDACGDNCQTALRIFCTEGRDAWQQSECWCGAGGLKEVYRERMENCLSTCDPAMSRIGVQRELMMRFRMVVCKGSVQGDAEFEEYYRTRYRERFLPDATRQAPPPVDPTNQPSATTTSPSTFATRTRTTRSSSSSSSSSSSTSSSSSSSSPSSRTTRPSSSTVPITSSRTSHTATVSASPTASTVVAGGNNLSTGTIVGISTASVLTFAVLLFILGFFLRRRRIQALRREQAKNPSPPPTAIERPVSIYYSPDDIGIAPAARGAWRSGDAHPGVRVPSVSPTEIDVSDDEDACSESSDSSGRSRSSENSGSSGSTGIGRQGFYDIDLGEYGVGYNGGSYGAARGYDPGGAGMSYDSWGARTGY